MNIPKDPIMLLSFINTQLRDNYSSLDLLCEECCINKEELVAKLLLIDYSYDDELNKFV